MVASFATASDLLGVGMGTVPMQIVGRRLPGLTWSGRKGIHVGVRRGDEVVGLVPGFAFDAVFDIEVGMVPDELGGVDFRGPYVHDCDGSPSVLLSWVETDPEGDIREFGRVRLQLRQIVDLFHDEVFTAQRLAAYLDLTDTADRPLIGMVRQPWVTWRVNGRRMPGIRP